jgi:CMP-N,N'-diacetyllegionaminic acid synthase
MSQRPRTLALIPARGGSKGVPRKNIKPLGGKPLIAWTIEAALRSRLVDAIVVSTDDEEIAAVAREYGAQVPYLRAASLARDDTPGIDPVLDALTRVPGFEAVVMLQPTSPLRTAADIDACIEFTETLGAPSAVSVSSAAHHPYWMYRLGGDHRLHAIVDTPPVTRRQDLPAVYALNGAVYYARTAWLCEHRAFVGTETVAYVMPPERSVDLDTLLDWDLAELLLTRTT